MRRDARSPPAGRRRIRRPTWRYNGPFTPDFSCEGVLIHDRLCARLDDAARSNLIALRSSLKPGRRRLHFKIVRPILATRRLAKFTGYCAEGCSRRWHRMRSLPSPPPNLRTYWRQRVQRGGSRLLSAGEGEFAGSSQFWERAVCWVAEALVVRSHLLARIPRCTSFSVGPPCSGAAPQSLSVSGSPTPSPSSGLLPLCQSDLEVVAISSRSASQNRRRYGR